MANRKTRRAAKSLNRNPGPDAPRGAPPPGQEVVPSSDEGFAAMTGNLSKAKRERLLGLLRGEITTADPHIQSFVTDFKTAFDEMGAAERELTMLARKTEDVRANIARLSGSLNQCVRNILRWDQELST